MTCVKSHVRSRGTRMMSSCVVLTVVYMSSSLGPRSRSSYLPACISYPIADQAAAAMHMWLVYRCISRTLKIAMAASGKTPGTRGNIGRAFGMLGSFHLEQHGNSYQGGHQAFYAIHSGPLGPAVVFLRAAALRPLIYLEPPT